MTAVLDERATLRAVRERAAFESLHVVIDPELDEPITDLGFVRSLVVDDDRVEAHLRLPTSFCSPSFAYLMASDAQDALTALPWTGQVVVALDDHHDSEVINAGLASGAGWSGTYGREGAESLDELRATFRRKAHTAALERSLTAVLRRDTEMTEVGLAAVTLGDLPDDETTASLHRRRTALGLGNHRDALVLVDEHGVPHPAQDAPRVLRRARATRVSVDGNAHFCRGLLRTRYPGSEEDQTRRTAGEEPADPTFVPLTSLSIHPATPEEQNR